MARGRSAFDADSAVREAIVYQIVVLGEAAKAVIAADASLASEVPEIEWSLLARMRDKVTHQYWAAIGRSSGLRLSGTCRPFGERWGG